MTQKELLHCAYDLVCAIEKNAGFPKLLDLSAGTGMTHVGYAQWKREVRESLAEPATASSPIDVLHLSERVVSWWNEHKHDTCGDYGERNVFDDEPEFVALAKAVLSEGHSRRTS